MKTYEEEYAELGAWLMEAHNKAWEKVDSLPKIGGYDDRSIPIMREVTQEWNRRLRELKAKYEDPFA